MKDNKIKASVYIDRDTMELLKADPYVKLMGFSGYINFLIQGELESIKKHQGKDEK